MTVSQPRFSDWIEAFRLRTLPLAVSTVLMGSFLAASEKKLRWDVTLLTLFTTLLLQILSNLANDYGDALKGTDNELRIGPERTVQSGRITPRQMKSMIILFSLFSFLSGLTLLFVALGNRIFVSLLFLLMGIGAIAAAIRYTTGKHAYGYKGWGDFFVFVFFGLVAVIGTYYLNVLQLKWNLLLPAFSMGFLSVGVLNLNNMRDIDNDSVVGKITVANRLGFQRAKIYHVFLIVCALLCALLFVLINYHSVWNFLFFLSVPLFVRDIRHIYSIKEKKLLDPFLKRLAITTLIFSLLFGIGICF